MKDQIQKVSTILENWKSGNDEYNQAIQNHCSVILKTISEIQKKLSVTEINDELAKASKEDEEEECEHWEHDHYICMDCGKDCINDFIGDAESAFEGDR